MAMTATRCRKGLASVALLLCATLLGSCGKTKTEAEYFHDAQTHRADGNVPAAIIDLKNLLQTSANNIDARILLAECLVDTGDGAGALAELSKAESAGAGLGLIAKDRAEALLLQGKPKDVLAMPDLPVTEPPETLAGVLSVRARADMALGQLDEAHAALDAGLEKDPHSFDVMSAMIRYALMRDDLNGARARLADAKALAPTDVRVVALEGDIALQAKDFASAEQLFQHVLEIESWNLTVRMRLAQAQIALGKFTNADANIATLLKQAPKNASVNYVAALSKYSAKQYNDALSYSQVALASTDDLAPALLIAGSSSYALNSYQTAKDFLTHYVYLVPDNLQARKLLAFVQIRLGQSADALNTLSPVVAKSGDDVELLALIGDAATRSGRVLEGERYYRMAVEKRPDDAALRAELGKTQLSLGDNDAGVKELEKAAADAPKELEPEVVLVQSLLRLKLFDKAIKEAQRIEERWPREPVAFDLAGIGFGLKGEDEPSREAFEKALALNPKDVTALNNLATLAARKGKFDDAAGYYRTLVKANPTDVRPALLLAESEARSGKLQESEATLRQTIAANPAAASPRFVLGRLLLLQGRSQEALDVGQPGLKSEPSNTALLEVVGRAQLALGHSDAALVAFKGLAEILPRVARAHVYLSEAYQAQQKSTQAWAELKTAIRLDSDDPDPKLRLVDLLSTQQNYDDAQKLIDDLLRTDPNDPRVYEGNGLIAMAQNRPDDAVDAYQRALKLKDTALYRSRLAAAYGRTGNAQEAKKALQPVIDANPKDIEPHLALAGIYASAKEADAAREELETVLKIDPSSVDAKLGLARLLVGKNDFDGARTLVDSTLKDNPNNAELAELAGIIADNQHRLPEAISALKRAVSLSDSGEDRILLATAQTDAGQFDDAQTSLQTWLRAHPNDVPVRLALGNVFMAMKHYDDAQAQFTELLALAPNNFVVENNLAEALMNLGKVQDALPHARHAAALAPWAPEVLDTLGTVLLNNRSTSEALAMFQSATRLAPTDPMLQFHLAQALVSAGERDRAKRLLRPILQQQQPFEERDAAQKLLTELGG